jgi:hypothetical protein
MELYGAVSTDRWPFDQWTGLASFRSVNYAWSVNWPIMLDFCTVGQLAWSVNLHSNEQVGQMVIGQLVIGQMVIGQLTPTVHIRYLCKKIMVYNY